MEEYLFRNETIVTRSGDNAVVLTTHRVRYENTEQSTMTTIMLDNISSIRVRSVSKPLYILLGVLCLVGAIALLQEPNGTYTIALVILAGIFFLLFFSSRRHIISIGSPSASIDFQTKGMKKEMVMDFVNSLEQARKDFLNY